MPQAPSQLYAPNQTGYTPVSPAQSNAGVVTQRFLKDMLPTGSYKKKSWPNAWKVDEGQIDRIVTTHAKMKADGHAIKLFGKHRTIEQLNAMKASGITEEIEKDASNVVAEVVESFRDGNRLMGIVEARGQKNIDLLLANRDVSVEVLDSVKDCQGRSYSDALVGVALAPNPAATGQSHFQPIAASADDDDGIYILTNEDDMNELETAKERVKVLEAEIAAAKAQIKTLSADDVPARTPRENALAAKVEQIKIDGLLRDALITDAMAKQLSADVIGDAEKAVFTPYILDASDKPDAKSVIDILETILRGPAPVKTGGTVRVLDNPLNAGGKDKPLTPEREAELLAMSGVHKKVA